MPFGVQPRKFAVPSACCCRQPARGQGIGLGWSLLTDDLLTRGARVRPLNASLRTRGAYYLVVAENGSGTEIDAFKHWMLEQFPMSVTEPVIDMTTVQNDEFS